MLQLQFPSSEPLYTFTSAIEGSTYIFEMQWMTRTSCWYMTISDSNSNVLASNLKIVPNFPLLLQKVSLEIDGDFLVSPITTATTLTADNLSTDWSLFYITEEEMEEGL